MALSLYMVRTCLWARCELVQAMPTRAHKHVPILTGYQSLPVGYQSGVVRSELRAVDERSRVIGY
jgi:hypothetical protein